MRVGSGNDYEQINIRLPNGDGIKPDVTPIKELLTDTRIFLLAMLALICPLSLTRIGRMCSPTIHTHSDSALSNQTALIYYLLT